MRPCESPLRSVRTLIVVLSIISVWLCLSGALSLIFAEPAPRRIAVVDFVERGDVRSKDAGKVVAELVASRLGRKYNVYERLLLSKIIREQKFSLNDIVETNDVATRLGRLAKVDLLLVGTVGKLGKDIVVTARLVDCTTGAVTENGSIVVRRLEYLPENINEILIQLNLSPRESASGSTSDQSSTARENDEDDLRKRHLFPIRNGKYSPWLIGFLVAIGIFLLLVIRGMR